MENKVWGSVEWSGLHSASHTVIKIWDLNRKKNKKRKDKNLKDPSLVYFNTKFMKHPFINATRELNY